MKMRTIVTALVLWNLSSALATTANAKVALDAGAENQGKEAVTQQEKKAGELRKLVNEDASKGLQKVRAAMRALDEGKAKDALPSLREALGSFEVALAADPKLDLVPVNSVVQAQALYTTPDDLKRELAFARELLGEGKVQEARSVLLPLRSDISVQTTYLPMKTYPDAIRQSIKALVDDKADDAKRVLSGAMGTLFVTEEVAAPIPLVTARSLIDQAAKMDKEKKEAVTADLKMAEEQLEVSRLLGYLPEDSQQYREMRDRVQKIMAEVKGPNRAASMYEEMKGALAKWLPW